MKYIKCQECHKFVDITLNNCPNCGNPISYKYEEKNKKLKTTDEIIAQKEFNYKTILIIGIILIVIITIIYYLLTLAPKSDKTLNITDLIGKWSVKTSSISSDNKFIETTLTLKENNECKYIKHKTPGGNYYYNSKKCTYKYDSRSNTKTIEFLNTSENDEFVRQKYNITDEGLSYNDIILKKEG